MLSPGTKLGGRYRLDERIAGGGMGDVWRGTDEVLGRTVAIKVMLPALLEEPGFAERFRGEARTMATINHSGVVDVYDYGSEAGTAFLIMEYVEGESLAQILGRVNRLTPARTMSLIEQAAEALQAAHSMGIVHRDVKPGNFLVRPNGSLVLTDFGIARSAQAAQLTAVGSVLGTASYLSPEQAAGEPATALSDIYSLGIVAYQCLSGHRPFEGENPIEIALRHLRDAPPPLPPDVPPVARQLVDRAMAKEPGARWPSASTLAEAARRAGSQLASGVTGTVATPSLPPPQGTTAIVGSHPRPGMPPTGPVGPGMPPTGPVGPGMPPGATRRMASVPPSPTSPGAPVSGTRAIPVSPAGRHPVTPYPPSSATGRAGASDGSGFGSGSVDSARRRSADARRQQAILMTALATFLCLVVGAGGIYLISQYHNSSGDGDGPSVPSSQPVESVTSPRSTQTPSRTANKTKPDSNLVSVECEDLRGRKKDDVESTLKSQGLKTRTESVPVKAGARVNDVVDLSPCGKVEKGTEITLEVASSKTQGSSTSPNTRPSACLEIGNNLVCPSSGP